MSKLFLESDGLRLFVYLIGYPPMGESQVVILRDSKLGINYFSAVVDCYTYKAINKTAEILTKFGIKEIDALCWTHPDEDHSIGLGEIFENFCTTNTLIILPEGMNGVVNATGKLDDIVDYNDEAKEFYSRINKNNSGRNYNVVSANVAPGGENILVRKRFATPVTMIGSYEFDFIVKALAPLSSIPRRNILSGSTLHKKNNLSIALMIQVGAEIKVFLAGDVLNSTIEKMQAFNFERLYYLKTPHHTSDTSEKLLDKFEECFEKHKIPITCTTGYPKSKLPDLDVVAKYQNYTEQFFSTHDPMGKADFGVIEFVANPFVPRYHKKLYGNANQLF